MTLMYEGNKFKWKYIKQIETKKWKKYMSFILVIKQNFSVSNKFYCFINSKITPVK